MEYLVPVLGLFEKYGLAVVLVVIFLRKFNTIMNNTSRERNEIQNKIFEFATNHIAHNTEALNALNERIKGGGERAIKEHEKIIDTMSLLQSQCREHIQGKEHIF